MKYRTFQAQFHQPVRDGTKISTIRGSVWCKVGERVGLRHWQGEPYKSHQGTLATAVVDQVASVYLCDEGPEVDGQIVHADDLAKQEGFASWAEMHAWFDKAHGLPYTGVITRWDPSTLVLGTAYAAPAGAIDIQVALALDDSCQEQYYARGHHDPAQFAAAINAYRVANNCKSLDLPLPKVRQIYWRTVHASADEDNVNFGEGFKFIESARGRGAYPVTVYDAWFRMWDFAPKKGIAS